MDYREAIFRWIDKQSWLDKIGNPLQEGVSKAFSSGGQAGIKVRDFLHGVWLGHPLHAVLTDVPIGAYTSTVALDTLELATGDDSFAKSSDVLLAAGIGSSVLAATAGITDWQHTVGHARRTGVLHALMNTTSLVFYILSYLARKRGKRGAGIGLAMLGYSTSLGAAYLGGHLSYHEKIGVNHAPESGDLPKDFTPVIADANLAEGVPTLVEYEGTPLLLVRRERKIFCLANTCAHLGGPLSEGELREDDSVVCPWHGSRFSLADGSIQQGPSTYPQPYLETRVRDGQVEVRFVENT